MGGTAVMTAGRLRRIRPVLLVALAAGAVVTAIQHRYQLGQAARLLTGTDWAWLTVGVAAELASMVAFAQLQLRLLRAARVEIGLGSLMGITLAGNAISTSVPGGVAWAATWAFGQLRRRGAERVVAGWVVLLSGALASFALFLIVAGGTWLAGSQGPVAGLRWLAALLAAVPILIGLAYADSRHSRRIRQLEQASWRAMTTRWAVMRHLGGAIGRLSGELSRVHLGVSGWTGSMGWALANWLTDGLVLVVSLEALHLHVPWRGVLVVYGVTQIAASLPVTPGGLGVVEGSMAALLVAYGTRPAPALAAVLLYRIISFWGLVPVGWASWLGLEVGSHHSATAPASPALIPVGASRLARSASAGPDNAPRLRPTLAGVSAGERAAAPDVGLPTAA